MSFIYANFDPFHIGYLSTILLNTQDSSEIGRKKPSDDDSDKENKIDDDDAYDGSISIWWR